MAKSSQIEMDARPAEEEPLAHQHWSRELEPPPCPEGWSTGPPDFVGLGVQRCGTSWWYGGALRRHPDVAEAPERRKEIHFFDRYWAEEPPDDFAERYARFFPRPPGAITGEWTPRYIYDPWTLPLLATAAPSARFLIMLRDPLERYRSGVEHEMARSRRRGQDPPNIAIVGDSVARGLYHDQVKRSFDLLGEERVLVLQYERCVAEPLAQMQRTQRFLGLRPLDELTGRLKRDKPASRPKPALPRHVHERLRATFGDDVRRLAELCPDIDPGLWPNFRDL
jgi:hypothetical protein